MGSWWFSEALPTSGPCFHGGKKIAFLGILSLCLIQPSPVKLCVGWKQVCVTMTFVSFCLPNWPLFKMQFTLEQHVICVIYCLPTIKLGKRKCYQENCNEEKIHLQYCTIFIGKKNPHGSGPTQFRAVLFKGQLHMHFDQCLPLPHSKDPDPSVVWLWH